MTGWLMLAHLAGLVLWLGGFLALGWSLRLGDLAELERRLLWRAVLPGLALVAASGVLLLSREPDYLMGEMWMRGKLALSLATVAATGVLWRASRRGWEGWGSIAAWHAAGLACAALALYLAVLRPV